MGELARPALRRGAEASRRRLRTDGPQLHPLAVQLPGSVAQLPLSEQLPEVSSRPGGAGSRARKGSRVPVDAVLECLGGALGLRLVLVRGFFGGSPAADGHPLARAWMSERLASVLDELS